MSRSVIYTVNTAEQTVTDGGTIALGSVVHRYGCNLALSGNTIYIDGVGYYSIDCTVIAAPTEVGEITVTLYRNGVALPGASASFTVSTIGDLVTLPIIYVDREACMCMGPTAITCVLSGVDATVSGITVRAVKE